ncbi:hypothetical protein DFH07DRAFT_772279 [Mycena maculata]|uniref:Uncharacterized protein n=1 Tax=Mycena maculata TaxID=230809 RepID=A0AAD7J7K1_9AGAR|nr:hypothetical protein DFH07DRAFT_772279 [Mycena maculata]
MFHIVDQSAFIDYICCLNSFFGTLSPRVLAQQDKLGLRNKLMVQLIKILQTKPFGTPAIVRIVNTTSELWKGIVGQRDPWSLNVMREMSVFCGGFPREAGWLEVMVSATTLIGFEQDVEVLEHLRRQGSNEAGGESQNVEWTYLALERTQQSWGDPDKWDADAMAACNGLVQALLYSGRLAEAPPLQSLRVILQLLSAPESGTWLQNPHLQPIMHEYSVWPRLGHIALTYQDQLGRRYMALGANISTIAAWRPVVYQDLPTWIDVFSGQEGAKLDTNPRGEFCKVVRNIWAPEVDPHAHDKYDYANETERSWALALMVLCNVWAEFAFNGPPSDQLFRAG